MHTTTRSGADRPSYTSSTVCIRYAPLCLTAARRSLFLLDRKAKKGRREKSSFLLIGTPRVSYHVPLHVTRLLLCRAGCSDRVQYLTPISIRCPNSSLPLIPTISIRCPNSSLPLIPTINQKICGAENMPPKWTARMLSGRSCHCEEFATAP